MKHLPKIQHLLAFRQVVHSRSIRAAARDMGLSQPALSRALRELETTLGAQLFLRGQEGITLTEAGHAFLLRAELIIEELQRAASEVEQINHFSHGKLAVGFSSLIASTIFPTVIDTFKSQWPHAKLYLKEGQIASLLPLLRQGELDLIIGTVNPRKVPDDVVIDPLFVASFCIIARRGHPLENATSISELHRAKWLLPETKVGYYQQLSDELNDFYRKIYHEPIWTESVICALNMVLKSDYLTIVARAMSMPLYLEEKISVLPVDTLPSAQYCVAWSQKSALTETARQFVLSLREASLKYQW